MSKASASVLLYQVLKDASVKITLNCQYGWYFLTTPLKKFFETLLGYNIWCDILFITTIFFWHLKFCFCPFHRLLGC